MVKNDIQLSKDTSASIISESLLGGKYISLSPGGDETDLKPGQTITITQSAVSLEEMLAENYAEVSQVLRDAFEDAILMGVDEQAMRQVLASIVAGLESPKRRVL